MIPVNNLKTDSENDNEKFMPLIPSPEPAIMSEYDEEEQNIWYFNDLFPFNIICHNDLKLENDNDDNDIDIIQSSEDMDLPPREVRHPFLRYEGLQYTKADIEDFETRLTKIYRREVHRVQVFDFGGLLDLMAEGLSGRMIMEHRELWEDSCWRIFLQPPSYTAIRDPILRLCHRLIACSIVGRSQAPKKVTVADLFYLRGMDIGSVNFPYLLARYLRLFAAGRKSGAHISRGQFVARLAEHFGLLTAKILVGLTVITPELPIIDMGELVSKSGYYWPQPDDGQSKEFRLHANILRPMYLIRDVE
ncbi:hypothetical protein Tco_0797664 [Tanacetum coccineum]